MDSISERVDGDGELLDGVERSRGDDGELVRADGGERVHVGGVELVRGGGDERVHANGDGELVCADGGERVHAAGGGELRSSGETCVGVEPIRRSSGETDSRGRKVQISVIVVVAVDEGVVEGVVASEFRLQAKQMPAVV
ncbi:hypothetical protein PInf_019733 [Phytophthora infestans]|nr:hypothetical protein PInf_019733 [Phytophthora infestans]